MPAACDSESSPLKVQLSNFKVTETANAGFMSLLQTLSVWSDTEKMLAHNCKAKIFYIKGY